MAKRTVVVVGAGLGGISAAIDLASRGYDVEILEAFESAGGKAGTVIVDGVALDTGPSVLTMPDVFEDLFRLAGRSLEDAVTFTTPDPAFRYVFGDGIELDVHPTLEATFASVAETLGPSAADDLRGFLDYARRIWEAAAPRFVYGDPPAMSMSMMAGLAMLDEARRIDPLSTMRRSIESRVEDPRLRALLLRYATYNGSDARRAPATLNCISYVELGLGGHGIRGGVGALVDALIAAARELGVRFTFGERVERIVTQGRRVVGVDSTRGHTAADAVVANADAAHVFEDLLPKPRRMNAERSMSGWNALVRTKRRDDRAAHTVLFPKVYLDEFADVFDRARPPQDPTVYVCAPSKNHDHPGFSEAEEALFVMVNAPPVGDAPIDYGRVEAAARERLVRHGMIEEGDPFVWTRTPRELAHRFFGSRGALYGAASNGPAAAFKRPANRVPRMKGLYLASGSAHPGGGMPLAVLSGRAAARALAEDLPCE